MRTLTHDTIEWTNSCEILECHDLLVLCLIYLQEVVFENSLRAGLHYSGEGLWLVKNVWPRHGYMRQMVDVSEKN